MRKKKDRGCLLDKATLQKKTGRTSKKKNVASSKKKQCCMGNDSRKKRNAKEKEKNRKRQKRGKPALTEKRGGFLSLRWHVEPEV